MNGFARLSCAVMLAAGAVACGRGSEPANSWDDPAITSVPGDDREMNAIIAEARRTIGEFKSLLAAKAATQTYASIKVRFEEAGKVEHIWLDDVRATQDSFEGVIGNTPVDIHRLKLGETVKVRLEDVSDWMVVDDGKLIGGRSIRLFRARMKPDERAAFDREMPFRIED